MSKRFLFILFPIILLYSCNKETSESKDFEFWKINIVTPDPVRTIDSLANKYQLAYKGDVSENNGFVSGSLELANASLQIKTYVDNAEHEPGPTEITLLTSLPDSIAYTKLKERGLEVNNPFRREGWNFSVITIPDLKILGEKSNGIYACIFDDNKDYITWRDSIRSLTNIRLETITVYAPNAMELKENWKKLDLDGPSTPKLNFITDSVNRMEIEID